MGNEGLARLWQLWEKAIKKGRKRKKHEENLHYYE